MAAGIMPKLYIRPGLDPCGMHARKQSAYAAQQLAYLFSAAYHSPFLIVPDHRLGVIARAGERGSRARSTKKTIDHNTIYFIGTLD